MGVYASPDRVLHCGRVHACDRLGSGSGGQGPLAAGPTNQRGQERGGARPTCPYRFPRWRQLPGPRSSDEMGGKGSLPQACAEQAPIARGYSAGVRRSRGKVALHAVCQVQAWSGPAARVPCTSQQRVLLAAPGSSPGGRASLVDVERGAHPEGPGSQVSASAVPLVQAGGIYGEEGGEGVGPRNGLTTPQYEPLPPPRTHLVVGHSDQSSERCPGKDGGRGSFEDSNSPAVAPRSRPTLIGPVDGDRDFSEWIPSPLLGNGAPGAPCSYLVGEPETERLPKRPSQKLHVCDVDAVDKGLGVQKVYVEDASHSPEEAAGQRWATYINVKDAVQRSTLGMPHTVPVPRRLRA
ncbi:hypothetical protein NDU88_001516 [Pleurodeles waltl]|uniref:Uncharacterized protein n=1 Tax=Pleurodeles waltl TaxID=8319 RepID=A0AAV7MJY0_PLEWA|nr:hypothetical protein NDU88_001516 [Pleurodeles waltl]